MFYLPSLERSLELALYRLPQRTYPLLFLEESLISLLGALLIYLLISGTRREISLLLVGLDISLEASFCFSREWSLLLGLGIPLPSSLPMSRLFSLSIDWFDYTLFLT